MRTSRARPLTPLLAALLFLGWVVAQSPHLVHHLFEEERAETECLLAASSERLTGLPPAVVVLTVEDVFTGALEAPSPTAPPTRPFSSVDARAPPLIAS
jgi:hypothetical protein